MTLVWVLLGAFIGWNFPQPFWAKAIQSKVQTWWKNHNAKDGK